jgi:hypothetical protein
VAQDSQLANQVLTTRKSPALVDAEKLAPQAVAAGDEEQRNAAKLREDDPVTADIHLRRALAKYERAKALARAARASSEQAEVDEIAARAEAERRAQVPDRERLRQESEDLEKKYAVVAHTQAPEATPATDPERSRARHAAARTFLDEARLLCGAAELLGAADKTLTERLATATKAYESRSTTEPAAYDEAVAMRAQCLLALTKQRRQAKAAGDHPDALLSELTSGGQWSARRDERGVIVAIEVGDNTPLTKDTVAKLEQLGRVANAHGAVAIQLVLDERAERQAAAIRDAMRLQRTGTLRETRAAKGQRGVQVVFVTAHE